MNNRVKELINLIINYLFYSRIDTDKKSFYYEKISNLVSEIVNSYDDVINFYKEISLVESAGLKRELMYFLQKFLSNSDILSTEQVIKLYLDSDELYFLNKKINLEMLKNFMMDNNIEESKIGKIFSISPKLGIEFLSKVKNHLVDVEYYPNMINNQSDFIELVNVSDALTNNTVSAIINNSAKFSNASVASLYQLAEDNSISELSFIPNDKQKRIVILSKLNENLFKKNISENDLEEFIANIKLKKLGNLPNGLKINILKMSLTNHLLGREELTYLLDNIDNKTISFASFSKYDYEEFKYVLTEYLNKLSNKSLEVILNLNSTAPDIKENILKYLISNKEFNFIEKYAKKIEITSDLFVSIIDNNINSINKFRINMETVSKDLALKLLQTPKYYSHLNSISLVYLLNLIDTEDMLNIINNKSMLSLLNPSDLSYIISLEYEDILNNDNIFEYYDKTLLLASTEEYLKNYDDIEFLLNKNISKLLFNNENMLSNSDIESVKYLIDYTRNVNRELTFLNIDMIKSFVALYLTFGIEGSIELINLTDVNPNIMDVIKIKDRLLQAKIDTFRIEKAGDINNAFNMIMYNLDKINSLEDVNNTNYSFNLFIKYSDKIEPFKAISLLKKYVMLKSMSNNEEELKRVKEEIRKQLKLATDTYINEKTSDYNRELTSKMKEKLRIKESVIEELSRKYSKELIIKNMMDEFRAIMNSQNKQDIKKKEEITAIFRKKINLYGLCDYEYFEKNMLEKILGDNFSKDTFLYYLGYDKPENYEHYIFNKRLKEEVNKINNLFCKSKDKDIMLKCLLGIEDISEIKDFNKINLVKEKSHAINKFRHYLNYDGNKLIYNLDDLPDENECQRYEEINMYLKSISKQIFNIMQSSFTPQERLGIDSKDLLDYFEGKITVNETNYEIVKNPLKTKEISLLFSNFDFSSHENEDLEEKIKRFVFNNIYSIRFLSDSDNQYYAKNFGYILSHYDKVSSICKALNINIDDINVEELKLLQDYILLELTSFGETVNKEIISKLINETDFVEIEESSKRVEMGINLLEASQKKIRSSVPSLKSPNYEILDSHDPKSLISGMVNSSCFRVGGTGNDFISYCVLSKDGSIIFLKNPKTDEVIGRISAVRRGNTYFLHQLQIKSDYAYESEVQEMCENSIQELSDDIINKTANTDEPIEYVTITTFKNFQNILKNKEELTKKKCSYVVDPIDITTSDYANYLSYPDLEKKSIYSSFYHNYDACETIIVSKSEHNPTIKDYSAKPIYLRERKKIEKYDLTENHMNISLEQKIRGILYLFYRKENDKLESDRNSKTYELDDLKEVTLGEDWCILQYNNGKVDRFNLEYDERSLEEENEYSKEAERKI